MLRRWLRPGRPAPVTDPSPAATPGSPAPAPTWVVPDTPAVSGKPSGPVADAGIGPDAEARVRALLASDAVTPATRRVLTARLDALGTPPMLVGACLSADHVVTLRAALDRLVPQGDRPRPVDIVAAIDARLAAGRSDGWRFDALPPDATALTRGLEGLNEAAWERHALHFADLSPARQDAILQLVQDGAVPGDIWRSLPPRPWFEELLAEATEIFYADPLAQEEIGYVGYADLPSWQAIGLDRRDDREPAAAPLSLTLTGARHDD